MTGDWAGAGGVVQVVRSGHVEGSEVPVVVLNDIKLLVLRCFYDLDSYLPDTSDRMCSRRTSPTPYRQSSRD